MNKIFVYVHQAFTIKKTNKAVNVNNINFYLQYVPTIVQSVFKTAVLNVTTL